MANKTTESSADQHGATDAERVMEWARELYAENPNWVQFYAAIWGPGGALEVVLPDRDERQQFQAGEQGRELQRMSASLRRRQDRQPGRKPTVTVTVRVPKPIHEALTAEAAYYNLSLHRLCLAKLVQPLVDEQPLER